VLKYGLAAVAVSLMWFFVRGWMNIPDDTPLFQEGVFLFADRLAVILGVAGIIVLVLSIIRR